MVKRMLRSRSLKRTQKKVPGGKVVTRYKKERPKLAKCRNCGSPLAGVPRKRPSEMKKIPKSQRRPSRPYGGNLCSKCAREVMREKVREI